MKPHRILTPFNGSQTGHDFQSFAAGTVVPLSAPLAAIAVGQGWAEPVTETPAPPQPARTPAAADDAKGPTSDAPADPLADRETKVVSPAETKPARPAPKKGKK